MVVTPRDLEEPLEELGLAAPSSHEVGSSSTSTDAAVTSGEQRAARAEALHSPPDRSAPPLSCRDKGCSTVGSDSM